MTGASSMTIAHQPDAQYPLDPTRLPTSWVVVPIGEVISDIRPGFSSGEHNIEGSGIPHLRPMNIDRRGRIALDQLKYVVPQNGLRAQRGDVVFNNTNSAELVGKTAAFDLDGEWGYSNHMTRLRPPAGVLPKFVAYQLHFLWQEGYFRLRRTQHVNQASISRQTLVSLPFVLAPTVDQEQVVAELERTFKRLDTAEEAAARAHDRLIQYEKEVVIAAAEGRLVPTEAEFKGAGAETGESLLGRIRAEVAEQASRGARRSPQRDLWADPLSAASPTRELGTELPSGWTWARVDEVGEVTLGRQRAPQHHQGPHMRPYLRVANVFEDRIDTSNIRLMNFTPEEYEIYALRRGDILLNEGQSPDLVGRPAMYRDEVPGSCFQKTLLRFRAKPGVSPTFALLVFRAYLHKGQFRKNARWSTNIAHLTRERFTAMPFPLPPLAEQERIVAEADHLLSTAEALASLVQSVTERVLSARHVASRQAFAGTLTEQIANEGSVQRLLAEIRSGDTRAIKAGRRDEMPRRSGSPKSVRQPLSEILRAQRAPLSPEDLLEQSGIGEDLIETFYDELRTEVLRGRIREDRDLEGDSFLVYLGDAE